MGKTGSKNKDAGKAYLNNYVENGFNKTKAMNEIFPNNDKHSNNANCTRYHDSVMVDDGIKKPFELTDITPAYIVESIDKLAKTAKKESDRIKCLELLGRFKALFTDKTENKTEMMVKDRREEDELDQISKRLEEGL